MATTKTRHKIVFTLSRLIRTAGATAVGFSVLFASAIEGKVNHNPDVVLRTIIRSRFALSCALNFGVDYHRVEGAESPVEATAAIPYDAGGFLRLCQAVVSFREHIEQSTRQRRKLDAGPHPSNSNRDTVLPDFPARPGRPAF